MSIQHRVSTKIVAGGVLVVALLLAGLISFYAASSPDGLTKVSVDKEFDGTETSHATAEGPFAGYDATFVDDERASVGIAGVVGVLATLVVAGGVTYGLRRLAPAAPDRSDGARPSAT